MADNFKHTLGDNEDIAADDVGGIKYQRVKVCVGADGTATDVSSTTPIPTSQAVVTAQGFTVSTVIAGSPATYNGLCAAETSTVNPATIKVYDNAVGASGTMLDVVELSAGESARDFYVGGIEAAEGLYVEVVGNVIGSIRFGA